MIPTFPPNFGSRKLIYALDMPSFQRDFASLKTLDHGTGPAITFTRASGATFFDANGVLQTAANDAPRFDHDPVTGESRGLLIEESRTNLLTKSAELDDAAWSKTRATITANAVTAPDGTTSADKLVEDSTASNTHRVGAPNYSAVSGTSYTFSVFLKSEERAHAQISLHITNAGNAFTTLPAIFVNLSTGAVTNPSATVTNSSIVSVGNGWWRVSISAAATSSGTQSAGIYLMSDATTTSYTGDATSGLYVWGAQVEAGAFPTSYIPTTTAAATRAADSAIVTPISSFYNQSEGTLFAEWRTGPSGVVSISRRVVSFISSVIQDSIQIISSNSNSVGPFVFANISSTATATAPSSPSAALFLSEYKQAAAWQPSSVSTSINGASVVNSIGNTYPTNIQEMRIGQLGAGTQLSGHIRKIAYWPKRLTNELLEQLTT